MSLLKIINLSHSFGEGALFKTAELSLNKGEHIGIVGQNGAGKSTLIKICTGQIIPDSGQVVWKPKTSIGYLDQRAQIEKSISVYDFLKSAFSELYGIEEKMNQLYLDAAGGTENALELAAKYQERLEKQDFYTIDAHIKQVASGLGLLSIGLDRFIGQMSGGQRAKVILAKLLLEKPEVLLLDEPTNFLDKEHVAWLAAYLSELQSAFLVVSHDYDFLEKIATHICDIDNGRITKYYGSYSEFLEKKTFLKEAYVRQYTAQQREIKKIEAFIRKNLAGRKAKMARGRQKQLDRLERMEALDQKEVRPHFQFTGPAYEVREALKVEHLTVGYSEPVLSELDFSIGGGQKVVITGFNGIGKSTLLKTLVRQLPTLKGAFSFAEQSIIGYFEQDLLWEDKGISPIQIISNAAPSLTIKEVRRQLARSGISNKKAVQAVGTLSGGEQAKVKLCLLTIRPCNFLILDEPTNHLDQKAKESLQEALKKFSGTVLLVSHEEAFYKAWIQRTINIEAAIT